MAHAVEDASARGAPTLRKPLTLADLRRYAIARSLFKPTTLGRAIKRLGFVQADPIRAPARAQDLTLRHRVQDYRAGDLERRYAELPLEEDFFVNYGFLHREHQELMHPRTARRAWSTMDSQHAAALLAFIRERGAAHPREVEAHFQHGKVKNWFGGASNATTQLLQTMHYRGLLRVLRRESGVRVYAPSRFGSAPHASSAVDRMDALVDLAIRKYAPLPGRSLGLLLSAVCRGVPQWRGQRAAALQRVKHRLAHARLEGIDWYWPAQDNPRSERWRTATAVRLLTPFDPVVWDRRRFELFWGWSYRFEAYTPRAKRKLGYYALPLLWDEQVIGWANAALIAGTLQCTFGFSGRAPRGAAYRRALAAEVAALSRFIAAAPVAN